LTPEQHHDALELFQADVVPVLNRGIPDPPWPPSTRSVSQPPALTAGVGG
jgi:hypothetical protein